MRNSRGQSRHSDKNPRNRRGAPGGARRPNTGAGDERRPRRQEHAGAAPQGERRAEDFCWGRNPVQALLEDSPARCLKVMLSKTMQRGFFDKITALCREAGVPFSLLEPAALDGILDGESHQGVIAVVAPMDMRSLEEAIALLPPPPEPALVVLLDHVQDPHNLGAMIRSAEASGAVFVAVPLRRGALPTGTVAKTSAGASLRLPIASVGNVANAVRELQNAHMWAVGLEAGAKRTIYEATLPKRCLLVVGGEGKGLSKTTASACDETLSIPIRGGAGSLNASVALSIGMFEWSRIYPGEDNDIQECGE